MPSITVLDVGHGTSIAVADGGCLMLIDAGGQALAREYLESIGVTHLSSVVISHGDADHMSGLLGLLADTSLSIDAIYLNGDRERGTKIWGRFEFALRDAMSRYDLQLHEITTDSTILDVGAFSFEVLWPTTVASRLGSLDGQNLDSNDLSAVVRVLYESQPRLLAAADIGDAGLQGIEAIGNDADAPVLVFPHHGGRPGRADPVDFSNRVCDLVRPSTVLFSIGRGQHVTPRPEIVAAIQARTCVDRVACSQLSRHCSDVGAASEAHLAPATAAGRGRRRCCAGTVVINGATESWSLSPSKEEHRAFIEASVPTPLCRALWDSL